jgi:hypothetical protein
MKIISKLKHKALNRAQMPFTTVVLKLHQGTPENGRSRCEAQSNEAIRRLFCFFFGEAKKKNDLTHTQLQFVNDS